MTRVIHTGDTHLGYQQYHRPERRQDFLAAFRRVADDAVADGVDAVVHAGDLFHDRRPTLPDIMGALSVLRTLDDAGIPFLAIVGNHESKRGGQWLDLFESLGLATRLGSDPIAVGDTAFYGLDFVPRSKRGDLDYDFTSHEAEAAALVSHGLFEPFPHGDWDAREILSGASVEFDALLLGDDHTPQRRHVEEPYEAWLTYCGSTERASASERDDRGYNLVTFDDGVDIRRRGLDTREFVFVDVTLAEGEGVGRVRQRVGQFDLTDAVVIVSIEGDGDPVAPATIEEYADEQGALVARVTDHRELVDEVETDVSFADPDEAVHERIRELGLSGAARDIDETIRASKVADANVADAIEDHVTALVDDGDVTAFAAADGDTPPAEEGTPTAEDSDGQVTMGDYS
jgi:DNA repair exonuclease SbcCD nuclease subunit